MAAWAHRAARRPGCRRVPCHRECPPEDRRWAKLKEFADKRLTYLLAKVPVSETGR